VLADPLPSAVLTSMASRRWITLVAGVSAWACNGDSTQPPGPPLDLMKSGGDAQTWYFNNRLPTPLSVTAVDASNRPVPGVVVTWAVTSSAGSGAVNPQQSTTDASGVATTTDSLGLSTTQTVSASFPGIQSAVTFTEIAFAPPTSGAVDVRDNNFNLQDIVVQTGSAVTWTRSGINHHTVTFVSGPSILAEIFEADLENGTAASRTRTFAVVGTYRYSCTNHPPNMNGSVTVVH
jgi:plastocyanin